MSKIVVVDDDENILEVYKDEIRIFFDSIDDFYFSSSTEALSFIKENQDVKLVITDGRMPELDGFELSKLVREINKDIKIIMVSGHFDFKESEEEIKQTLDDFIEKPVDFDEFQKLIKKNLDN